jgi:uncharacterized membrane protein
MKRRTLACGLLVLLLGGCPTNGAGDAGDTGGLNTGSVCPPASTLTYDTFASTFFSTYCLRCHSVMNVTSTERNGAPPDVNFDTHDLIIPLAARIDRMAAIGPARENRIMPLNGLRPTDDERRLLGEWLACGTP